MQKKLNSEAKPRNSKTLLRIGIIPATSRFGVLRPCPRSHGRSTIAQNCSQIKQLHLLKNCQCDSAKVTANTNRHNFACYKLEYNKLNLINCKA